MNTSDKQKALFDFHRFSKSEKLEGVINSTLASVENQLNEADLDMVSAAGYTGEIRLYGDKTKGDDISIKAGIFGTSIFDLSYLPNEHIANHESHNSSYVLKEYEGIR